MEGTGCRQHQEPTVGAEGDAGALQPLRDELDRIMRVIYAIDDGSDRRPGWRSRLRDAYRDKAIVLEAVQHADPTYRPIDVAKGIEDARRRTESLTRAIDDVGPG
jgi:hypothetical protein